MSAAPEAVRALFDNVREAASPQTWSRGVQLARRQSIDLESQESSEIALRVSGGRSTATVYLRPEDREWECECDENDDVCDHVAAAVIALRQAIDQGATLQKRERVRERIGYRFVSKERSVELRRVRVRQGGEKPLAGSLASLVGPRADTDVDVRALDLKVEELVGVRGDTPLHSATMRRLLRALADCDQVKLDGEPVEPSSQEVLPIAVVEDNGEGFALTFRRDPSVTRAYVNGAALCGKLLRPIGESPLTQRERDQWGHGRYFGPSEQTELASEIVPSLERRMPVDLRTQRLRRVVATPPRLEIETQRHGDRLRVRCEIVYGDPAIARVQSGMLVSVSGELPRRDRAAEESLIVQAERELGLTLGEITLDTEAGIALRPRLDELGVAVKGGAHAQFFLAPALEVDLELDAAHFDASFRTRVGGRVVRVDGATALAGWTSGQSLAALPGGGFAELPPELMAKHGAALVDLLAARRASREIPACALPDLARLCTSLGEPPPRMPEGLRALVEDFAGLPPPELPPDLRADLRAYQQRGVAWLQMLRKAELGGLLADDMGLGKTLQALCALRGRSLVVCPTSVLHGWSEQARRFRPDTRICVYHGPDRELDATADLTLTSYALLRSDIEKLATIRWDCAVLDEAQAIKNPDSQVARAAYRLNAAFRLALTGTPVENRLEELWSQLHFLDPGLLGGREQFDQRYAKPILAGERGAAASLRARLRPFLLRRMKKEVAPELPPRTEAVLHCELSNDERAIYEAVRSATQADVVARLRQGGSVLEALEALLRLRQAACHSALVPGQRDVGSAKLDVLLESLREAASEGHKALVFSQWTGFLDLVEPRLREAELRFTRLDGSTRDRGAVVESFQDPAGPPVLLISLRAGGTGLNLTAADHVFLLDPWWNPAVEEQAADRAHRIGQERPVFVYRLVSVNTVEERILALQAHKRALAQTALEGADRAATGLTREDLLGLLE